MNTFYLEGPGGIPGVQQTPQGSQVHTKKPFAFDGGISIGGLIGGTLGSGNNTPPTLASAATVAFTPVARLTQHTPSQSETINFTTTGYLYGSEICLEIITSGTSSFTLTFGTGAKSTGTLATGTTSAKVFMINFIFDGTNWVEESRTTAM